MNIWHDISADRIKKDDFISVVEIEKGGTNKYELDKATGLLRLDRVLYTSTHYPANYGFIPRTYADDGDPLDVLVICQEKIVPLTLVECYPIGVMIMTDNDDLDEKIIAIPKSDPFLNDYKDINELPEQYSAEIIHFSIIFSAVSLPHISFTSVFLFSNCLYTSKKCISSAEYCSGNSLISL